MLRTIIKYPLLVIASLLLLWATASMADPLRGAAAGAAVGGIVGGSGNAALRGAAAGAAVGAIVRPRYRW